MAAEHMAPEHMAPEHRAPEHRAPEAATDAGGRPTAAGSGPGGPLLVAFDGSAPARQAVHWAVREAAASGRALHLVTVLRWPVPELDGLGLPATALDGVAARRSAEAVMAHAVDRCRDQAPGVDVTGEVCQGDAVASLQEHRAGAALLVLGASGQTGSNRVLLGSTASELLRDAASDVVIVRGTGGALHGPVVIGVDGSPESVRALRFGFAHAERLHRPVVVVHAWSDIPLPALAGHVDLDRDDVRERATAALAAWIADLHHEHPGVPVSTAVATDRPVDALLAHAGSAELLVVGRHGRARSGGPLGSVSHAVAHYAPCAVAVIGPG